MDTFPGQSIDFFGALRARVYDDLVRDWVNSVSPHATPQPPLVPCSGPAGPLLHTYSRAQALSGQDSRLGAHSQRGGNEGPLNIWELE